MDISKNQNKSSLHHFRKTKMCPYFARKSCFFPESCHYAHSIAELRTAPDLFRTSLCKSFLETGTCVNRHHCRFAHGIDELRFTNDYYKTRMCEVFEQTGHCSAGITCRYAHGLDELRPTPIKVKNDDADEILMSTVSATALKGLSSPSVILRLRTLCKKIDYLLSFVQSHSSELYDIAHIPSFPRIISAYHKLRLVVLSKDVESIIVPPRHASADAAIIGNSLALAIELHEKLTQLLGFIEVLVQKKSPVEVPKETPIMINVTDASESFPRPQITPAVATPIVTPPVVVAPTVVTNTSMGTQGMVTQSGAPQTGGTQLVGGTSVKMMQLHTRVLGKALSILPVKPGSEGAKGCLAVPCPPTPVTGSVFSLRKNQMMEKEEAGKKGRRGFLGEEREEREERGGYREEMRGFREENEERREEEERHDGISIRVLGSNTPVYPNAPSYAYPYAQYGNMPSNAYGNTNLYYGGFYEGGGSSLYNPVPSNKVSTNDYTTCVHTAAESQEEDLLLREAMRDVING